MAFVVCLQRAPSLGRLGLATSARCCATPVDAPRSYTPADLLRHVSKRARVDDRCADKLFDLADFLLEANKTTNVTAVRSRDAFIIRHLVDGIGLLSFLDPLEPQRLVDVGSGAGLPGLVLAICRPEWHVTLVDSVRKKTRVQASACEELDIGNVRCVWGRAETIGQETEHREAYDVACARAVAEMRVLAELTLPLVAVGGAVVAQKSVERDGNYEEIDRAAGAIRSLGGRLDGVHPAWTEDETLQFDLKSSSDQGEPAHLRRSIAIIRKERSTSSHYPRDPGVPKKSPL